MDIILYIVVILAFIMLLIFWNKISFEKKIIIIGFITVAQPLLQLMGKKFTILFIFIPIMLICDILHGNIIRRFDKSTMVFTFFIYIIMISTIKGNNIMASITWIIVWIEYYLVFFWASHYKMRKLDILKIFNFFILCGLIISCIGIIQYIYIQLYDGWNNYLNYIINSNIGEYIYSGNVVQSLNQGLGNWVNYTTGKINFRSVSIFTGPDGNGMFTIFSLSLGLAMIKLKCGNKLINLSIIVNLMNLLLSYGRASWIGFMFMIIFLMINFRIDKRLKIDLKILVPIIILFIIIVVVNPAILNNFLQVFQSITNTQEMSNAGRLDIWSQNIYMTTLNLFLGCGIGNYNDMVIATFNLPQVDIQYTAHNAYFLFSVECGIIGVLIFFITHISFIKDSIKLFKLSNNKLEKVYGIFVASFLVGIMAQYIFDYDFSNFRLMPLLFLNVGIMLNLLYTNINTNNSFKR